MFIWVLRWTPSKSMAPSYHWCLSIMLPSSVSVFLCLYLCLSLFLSLFACVCVSAKLTDQWIKEICLPHLPTCLWVGGVSLLFTWVLWTWIHSPMFMCRYSVDSAIFPGPQIASLGDKKTFHVRHKGKLSQVAKLLPAGHNRGNAQGSQVQKTQAGRPGVHRMPN